MALKLKKMVVPAARKPKARKAKTFSAAEIKAHIHASGAFIEDLVKIRQLLGETPELAAIFNAEVATLRYLIAELLTARGIVITPVVTVVADANITEPAAG